jgi:hypothetical protein
VSLLQFYLRLHKDTAPAHLALKSFELWYYLRQMLQQLAGVALTIESFGRNVMACRSEARGGADKITTVT